ncbi:hypothetical protein MCOR25_005242 [Pyricularia grisea]|nr:hypothetical protein MCOR25_005242 [Pyricularia grisea]
MTARKFKADVLAAATQAEAGRIKNVSSVRGDDDEVIVTYFNKQLPKSLQVRLLAADVDRYPGPCSFLLFTDDEEAPRQIVKVLEQVQTHLAAGGSFTILRAVTYLSKNLDKCLEQFLSLDSHNSSDAEMTDIDGIDDKDDDDDGDDDDVDDSFDVNSTDDEADDEGFFAQMSGGAAGVPNMNTQLSQSQLQDQERIRGNLRKAKQSGCKIGILVGLLPGHSSHIFSMSVRIGKIGLSEENLLAWGLSASDYLVLLVSISDTTFPTMESLMERPAAHSGLRFRIRKCANFKPTVSQAIKAFNEAIIRDDELEGSAPHSSLSDPPLERIFLSRSFDDFMSEYFVSLVKLRENLGCSWDDANESLIDGMSNTDDLSKQYPAEKPTKMDDHLASGVRKERSIPLICWEFAMKYFKDCTKYCLRCHRLVKNDVGSLKPFVCSNELCLFQYMQMGLGPSVEHEILTQPKVVDLLCSFCYSSTVSPARNMMITGADLSGNNKYAIREFPVGLSLKVPDFFSQRQSSAPLPRCIPVQVTDLGQSLLLQTYEHDDWLEALRPGICYALVSRFTLLSHGFTFQDNTFSSKLATRYSRPTVAKVLNNQLGNQVINGISASTESITYGNVVSIDRTEGAVVISVAGRRGRAIGSGATEEISPGHDPAQLYLATFDTSFDTLLDDGKAVAIRFILDMLPPIADIRAFLKKSPNSSVKGMNQMLAPTATLLEWIVATNRSLIMCLEEEEDDINPTLDATPTQSLASLKIPEMSDYIQFRFAQGSPDKEERFKKELNRAGVVGSKHPTIFAWHGSSQPNWHSIIRTGLDFSNVINGRAFGNGIYFSQYFTTSMGRNPHLVVQNIDWQQCRYLFVKKPTVPEMGSSLGAVTPSATLQHRVFIEQDPYMIPQGADSRPLRIPRAAIPSSGSQMWPKNDGYKSDDDDIDVLKEVVEISSDEDDSDTDVELLEVRTIKPAHLTDFQPGTLDLASLPRLAPPQRSGGAGRQLAREISALRKIQEATPSHELGWYIEFDGMSNMFQMIVELHSFDKTKPLGRSMAQKNVTSIVIELRFSENFPISPPFVRVIRPRFLPFHAGGGGHVTIGGAMCMELLTSTGWSPACSIEHVLIMVRLALVSEDPKPAQIEGVGGGDYDIGGAIAAYRRAATVHGWQIPPDLNQTAMGAGSGSA